MKIKSQSILRKTSLLIILLTFLSLGILMLYFFAAMMQSLPAETNLWNDSAGILFFLGVTLFFFILPVLYFLLNMYIFRKVLSSPVAIPKVLPKVRMSANAFFFIAVLVCNIVLTSLIMVITYDILTEKPPHFFPFDDRQASYTIEKNIFGDGLYNIHYMTTSEGANKHYVCEQESGKKESCFWEYNRDVQTMIIESPLGLEQFVNKEVFVTGEFLYSNKQCIRKVCRKLSSGWAGLSIKSIRAK